MASGRDPLKKGVPGINPFFKINPETIEPIAKMVKDITILFGDSTIPLKRLGNLILVESPRNTNLISLVL
jgi:hypothetical protein